MHARRTSRRAALAAGALVLGLPLAAAAMVLVAGRVLTAPALEQSVAHREMDWRGSDACRSCHPDHHASWYRTFHRTMTQEASEDSVLGAFDGRLVDLWGVKARPVKRDGRFLIEYVNDEGGAFRTLEVKRTVGSRRYQQYLVQNDDDQSQNYYRIPLLWHVAEQRWIHLNGAFLGHDRQPYDRHLALWNQNCIFCHNTGPEPRSLNYDELVARARRGESVSWEYDGRYDSAVAELGISCESCHAPSEAHVTDNRNPIRRYWMHLTGADDPSIVNPAELTKERSIDVCGQCHGQRLASPPASIRDWMHDGPIYRAGERLEDSVTPVSRDTRGPPDDPDLFRLRFWGDGTPRLTAYEYQGVRMSPCHEAGEMTCLSCHSMHGGDVRGQIEPEMRTNEACRDCHADLVEGVAEHSKHDPSGSGALCYDCHMPRMVYGILEIHRSHHVENPDPARDAANARPNACTSCHLDRSLAWAGEAMRELWGADHAVPSARADGAPVELVDLTAALLGGDPVQRAVAAERAGRAGTPLTASEESFLWPLLLGALEDDYPAVRWFARRSLMALAERGGPPALATAVRDFDYIAPAEERTRAVKPMRDAWLAYAHEQPLPVPPPGSLVTAEHGLDLEGIAPLVRARLGKSINIGE